MLYITRVSGDQKYWVFDTDDGVETEHTAEDIWKACLIYNIEIKGVEIDEFHTITDIRVWQSVDSLTRAQVKAKVLLGLDVIVANGEIASMVSEDKLTVDTVKVRLSDYGNRCGEAICQRLVLNESETLILVLDDKVNISSKTFLGISQDDSVYVDCSEVTREDTLDALYLTEVASNSNNNWIYAHVIDSNARRDKWVGIGLVRGSSSVGLMPEGIAGAFQSYSDTLREVTEFFRADFMALKDGLRFEFDEQHSFWIKSFVESLEVRRFLKVEGDSRKEYEVCHTSCYMLLRHLISWDPKIQDLARFLRYDRYFTPYPEFKQLLVSICRDWVHYCIDYVKKLGGS